MRKRDVVKREATMTATTRRILYDQARSA